MSWYDLRRLHLTYLTHVPQTINYYFPDWGGLRTDSTVYKSMVTLLSCVQAWRGALISDSSQDVPTTHIYIEHYITIHWHKPLGGGLIADSSNIRLGAFIIESTPPQYRKASECISIIIVLFSSVFIYAYTSMFVSLLVWPRLTAEIMSIYAQSCRHTITVLDGHIYDQWSWASFTGIALNNRMVWYHILYLSTLGCYPPPGQIYSLTSAWQRPSHVTWRHVWHC